MKVVQINAVYGISSTGRIIRNIDDTARENGIQSFVAYQYTNEKISNGYRIGNVVDWKIHAFLTRLVGSQAIFSRFATKRLIKWLKNLKPDVIHLHNVHANYLNLPLLLKYVAENDIKLILTLHDCWFFTGKCFHFVESDCDKWQSSCGNCPRLKLDIKSLFFDKTKKNLLQKKNLFANIKDLTVVGCSEWIASLARFSTVFKDKNVISIINGVDLSVFHPTNNAFKKGNNMENKFVILGFANKWFNPKNKEVFDKIISDLTDEDVVVLVGCSEAQKQALSQYEKIIALGFINDSKVLADIYSSCDVFVNLTLADTLPTVNMESIACGTPVITYNVCGSPELVIENKTGYVIEKFDFDSLKNRIDKIKNGGIDTKICVKTASEKFSNKNNYLKYISIYKGV